MPSKRNIHSLNKKFMRGNNRKLVSQFKLPQESMMLATSIKQGERGIAIGNLNDFWAGSANNKLAPIVSNPDKGVESGLDKSPAGTNKINSLIVRSQTGSSRKDIVPIG